MRISKKANFIALWRTLTEPAASIQKLDERRTVRLFSVVQIILLISLIPPAVFSLETEISQGSFIILFVALSVSYGLSRTRYHKWGIWLSLVFLGGFSISPVFFAQEANASQLSQNMMWVILPLILASMILTTAKAVVLTIGVLVIILSIPAIVSAVQVADIMPVFGFVLTWVAAHMTFLKHIHSLEKDRQFELEQKASQLAEVNKTLHVEITERKLAEEKIEVSLHEKEVLLKEIHHRVKNNLQVISSMLNLQSSYLTDESSLAIFQDSQNRVRSMALVHEKLYQSANLSQVDFGEYIQNLTTYLFRSYGVEAIQLQIESETVFLGIDTAVPCGLILNELVSNALTHAFPGGREGNIAIELRGSGQQEISLRVSDNGVGLPPGLDYLYTTSLGLQLVSSLVEQINGRLHLDRENGTAFTITFSEPR